MKGVELYARVRFAVQIEGVSQREAARRFGIDPRTVAKMLVFSVPPGYRRRRPPVRPKLDPFTEIIDAILVADEGRPRKHNYSHRPCALHCTQIGRGSLAFVIQSPALFRTELAPLPLQSLPAFCAC